MFCNKTSVLWHPCAHGPSPPVPWPGWNNYPKEWNVIIIKFYNLRIKLCKPGPGEDTLANSYVCEQIVKFTDTRLQMGRADELMLGCSPYQTDTYDPR